MKFIKINTLPAKKNLKQLEKIERREHHPLIHRIHEKNHLSKKTLFYIKEYSSKSHIARVIIKESIGILIFASLLSALGGFSLEYIKERFISLMPLIMLLPALNGMIGGYGIIISSRFTALLHSGKHENKEYPEIIKNLHAQVLISSFITAVLGIIIALIISAFSGNGFDINTAVKIFVIVLLDVFILIFLLFTIAIHAGLYFFSKGEDPNNLLIPLTTSIADFGNMIVLAFLVMMFF